MANRLFQAVMLIERDGIEGFQGASKLTGDQMAYGLLVAHVRRAYGSMASFPPDPTINDRVDAFLAKELPAVHAILSQPVSLFYTSIDDWADNFSPFSVMWMDRLYPTASHLYQARKYVTSDGSYILNKHGADISELIRVAASPNAARKIGRLHEPFRRKDWSDELRLEIMEEILRAKVEQHPHIARKLRDRRGVTMVLNSPKDDFWGRGPHWDGKNHLGNLWKKIAAE